MIDKLCSCQAQNLQYIFFYHYGVTYILSEFIVIFLYIHTYIDLYVILFCVCIHVNAVYWVFNQTQIKSLLNININMYL